MTLEEPSSVARTKAWSSPHPTPLNEHLPLLPTAQTQPLCPVGFLACLCRNWGHGLWTTTSVSMGRSGTLHGPEKSGPSCFWSEAQVLLQGLPRGLASLNQQVTGPLLPSSPPARVLGVPMSVSQHCRTTPLPSFANHSSSTTNPSRAARSPCASMAGKAEVYIHPWTFLLFIFSLSHICSLFSLISNVSQHIMFSEVFKTDWEMLLEAVFYSTVCTLLYCQIKIKM